VKGKLLSGPVVFGAADGLTVALGLVGSLPRQPAALVHAAFGAGLAELVGMTGGRAHLGGISLRRPVWHKHPTVNKDLTFGERAADRLKQGFGSWPFLIILNSIIVALIVAQTLLGRNAFDPYPWLLLNIGLSWLAAQQGGALQIAANRGDRINSEVAVRTEHNTAALLAVNDQQLKILQRLDSIQAQITAQAESADAQTTPDAKDGTAT
jgi:uncharacterized membrane protein